MAYESEGGGARAGATIHALKSLPRQASPGDLHFAFRIDNFPHLVCAFGPAVAHAAVGEVVRIVTELFGEGGLVLREGDGLISALLWDPALIGNGPLARGCGRLIHDLADAVVTSLIVFDEHAVHVSLSGAWSSLNCPNRHGGAFTSLGKISFPGVAASDDADWILRYRADMMLATDLLRLVDKDCLELAWQPIRAGGVQGSTLYWEAVLWLVGENGEGCPAAASVHALERLGLVRPLDCRVVNRVLDELERNPFVALAANISAQSAIYDGWWSDVVDRLVRRSDVAGRLVLEITETSPFPSIGDAIEFADRLRKLGCRIALDGFGAGHASIRQLLAFRPDIAKVDGFFLRRARQSPGDLEIFQKLVQLAGAMAPVVIVEGAEEAESAELANAVGGKWQQGRYHGEPAITRTWMATGHLAGSEAFRSFEACFEDIADRSLVELVRHEQ